MANKKDQIRLAVRKKQNIDPLTWRERPLPGNPKIRVLEARQYNSTEWNIYSYRFSKAEFTIKTARKWLEEHGLREYLAWPKFDKIYGKKETGRAKNKKIV